VDHGRGHCRLVLIYLVLLKIELKAARLWLCFWGAVCGIILMIASGDFLANQFVSDAQGRGVVFVLLMPFVFLVGGGLGFWVTARIVR
jgi:hypothetical protein